MPKKFFDKKTILVTGGTGSFGQAFVDTVLAKAKPKKVIIFSRDEFKQHHMRQRMGIDMTHDVVRFFIGDVRELSRLERALRGVDVIVHAAALKQVPALEYNPFEAVKTNILGTQNVVEAAINQKVKRVIALSTDKAVNPINLYGATKLCAEKLIISGNAYSGGQTIFGVVRYGNVVGSRGSIVELIKQQRDKGPVTLTDERMTRFWITLDQAVKLVFDAVMTMKGGEIFIPKIPSMKVAHLIDALAPKAKIKIIGIRPGEKLHEALMTEHEAHHAREYKDWYIIQPRFEWWTDPRREGGKTVRPDFNYTSDTNDHWLTAAQLKNLAA